MQAQRAAPRLGRRARKYAAVFHAELVHKLAYPVDLAVGSVMIVLFLWIFVHLWGAAYDSAGRSEIAGLSLRQTLWYLVMAEAVILSRARVASQIATMVRDGSIVHALNRPYSLPLYQAAAAAADCVVRIAVNSRPGERWCGSSRARPPGPVDGRWWPWPWPRDGRSTSVSRR